MWPVISIMEVYNLSKLKWPMALWVHQKSPSQIFTTQGIASLSPTNRRPSCSVMPNDPTLFRRCWHHESELYPKQMVLSQVGSLTTQRVPAWHAAAWGEASGQSWIVQVTSWIAATEAQVAGSTMSI